MEDVFEILRGAATSDSEIAAALRQTNERRHQDMVQLARSLAAKGALRPGVTEEEAADLFWAMSAPDWYRMLVTERGWSPEQYEAWQAFTLTAYLLAGRQSPC